jgi:branched-chain amino acid transport system substrate-binding protein
VADAPSGEGREGRATPLRTFLIADIRGYTRFSQDHGDEAASRLARRFADIVREAVPHEVGELLELRGDEALCVFSSAREALQTAVELQRRLREQSDGEPVIPLGVGIGLDAGEAVPIEGGYRGRALNVAARLSALAHPGEILASETVVSLAGRQEGTSYTRRRPARLKGFAEPVRHVAVVPDVALPPLPPPLPAKDRPRRARRLWPGRAWALVAVGGAIVVAAAAFAVVRLTGGGGGTPRVEGSGVASIDSEGRAVASFKPAGRTPSNIAVGEGAVWVLDADDRTISQIDPKSGDMKTFSTGTTPNDIVVGGGALWIGNTDLNGGYSASVSKVDPVSGRLIGTLRLRRPVRGAEPVYPFPGVSQLAFGAGSLWAVNPDGSVSRFDAETDERQATLPVHATSFGGIAFGSDGLWAVGDGPSLTRIDAKTDRVGEPIPLVATRLAGIAAGAGAVWAAAPDEGVVWRIKPGNPPVAISLGRGVIALAFGEGALWAANYADGTVARIDPTTNEVTRPFAFSGNVQGIAAGAGSAWVSVVGWTSTSALSTPACAPPESGGKRPDVLIASDLPLQGAQAPQTRALPEAIRFVLRRHGFRAGGYTVGYQSCDDATAQANFFSEVKCMANARAYGAAKKLVAVIGTYNSDCAEWEVPITNRAPTGPVPMISPANTYPGLTRKTRSNLRPEEPGSFYPTGMRHYFRVIADDGFQGAAAALLARRLGLKRVYVLDMPGGAVAAGFPEALKVGFETAARQLGLRLVGSRSFQGGAASYAALAERVARARPDGVFLASVSDFSGSDVVKALRERLGADVVLLANESFDYPPVLDQMGSAAEGMYITQTWVPVNGLGESGKRLVRAFAATQPKGAYLGFVPETMQAVEVLLQAIARSDGTRRSVLEQLRRTHVENGVLGSFRFDARGDVSPRLITLNRVERDRIVFNRVISMPATLVP